jgi:phage shock protein C
MSSKPCGQLYRDPSRGKIAGVCAGLADYLGWETWLVRILVVSGVLFGMPFLVMIYVAAWFILDKKPANMSQHGEQIHGSHQSKANTSNLDASIKVKARIWQSGEPPKQAFHDIRRKFNGLETQLRIMERYVTSPEFSLSREINKL